MPPMATSRYHLPLGLCAFLLVCLCFWPDSSNAQFGPLSGSTRAPQARSQEELDAYLQILAESKEEVIKSVNAFAVQYPKSELLGVAYQYQMHAYEQLGDFDGMLNAGRKALIGAPDNLDTLLTLAPEIANHLSARPDRAQLLTEAEGYARLALDGLEKVRPPHGISVEDWEKQKRAMQCKAHEVLGVVAVSQNKKADAVSEFRTVVQLASPPTGEQYFRLAFALASAGEKTEAAEYFHRAIALGPEPVRKLALQQLAGLSNANPSP